MISSAHAHKVYTEFNRLRWKRSAQCKQKGNILLPLVSAVAVLALIAAGYFFWQTQQLQNVVSSQDPVLNQPPSAPTLAPQDETTNWKTYTNSTSNYSIKYPSNWKLVDQTREVKGDDGTAASNVESLVTLSPADSPVTLSEKPVAIQVGTGTYEHELELDRGYPGGINVDRVEKEITVAGYPAIKITGRVVLGGEMASEPVDKKVISILINKKGKPYRLVSTPEYEKEFDQILSTFKFL